MKLPRSLYVGYNLLKKSRVAVRKENDEEALEFFQNILNEAQPSTPEDLLLHKFVKGMYNENKYKFIAFIKNTSHECLVLWTESKSIVNCLGLRGVVYVKWTGKETLYSVSQYQSTSTEDGVAGTSYEHPLVRRQRVEKEKEKVEETPETETEPEKVEETPETETETETEKGEETETETETETEPISLQSVMSVSTLAWGDMV